MTDNELDALERQNKESKPEATEEKYKLSEEVARKQLQGFMDSYGINISILPEDQLDSMEYVVNWLVDAIRMGKIEMLENGTVKHNLSKKYADVDFLIYQRLTGTAEREYAAEKNSFTSHMAQMGSLCNLTKSAMASLDAKDRSVAEKISLLFTSV